MKTKKWNGISWETSVQQNEILGQKPAISNINSLPVLVYYIQDSTTPYYAVVSKSFNGSTWGIDVEILDDTTLMELTQLNSIEKHPTNIFGIFTKRVL